MRTHDGGSTVKYEYVSTREQLEGLCQRLESAEYICFDTEFVSEDTFRPDLCLIQVAAGDDLAVVDPRQVEDVSLFWRTVSGGSHRTIVHAGREEFRFCLQSTGRRPTGWFDTQIAAGLVGLDYPTSYGKLIQRLLGKTLPKGETRTDWRRRPLTERQIEYALQDVTYLEPMFRQIQGKLVQLGREAWMEEEMDRWQTGIEAFEQRENWRRVSGASGLSDKARVIVRELWRWRQAIAEQTNRPPRRILRDDLIVELARRGKSDPNHIRAIRGIERSVSKRHFPEIAQRIETALALPREQWPAPEPRKLSGRATLVSQFISTALSSICRQQSLAPGLVGTVQDVRDLVEYRLLTIERGEAPSDREVPNLARGWRAEVIGHTIDELLAGNLAIRIADPRAEDPLALDAVPTRATKREA